VDIAVSHMVRDLSVSVHSTQNRSSQLLSNNSSSMTVRVATTTGHFLTNSHPITLHTSSGLPISIDLEEHMCNTYQILILLFGISEALFVVDRDKYYHIKIILMPLKSTVRGNNITNMI
jgi:hypothetical protein